MYIFVENVAKNVAKMSPRCSRPQTLVALRLKSLFFRIWHSALKGGVVVAPPLSPQKLKSKTKNPKT